MSLGMAIFCIPAEFSSRLKDAVRAGQFDVAALYDMSSTERRDLFTQYTDPEMGQFLNRKFEEAIVSRQKNALAEWVQGTFSTVQKKSPGYGKVLEKIEALDELGVIGTEGDAFLEDLVAQKLGMTLTAEEVQTIREKSANLEKLYAEVDNIGDPSENRQAQVEYFKALEDANDYVRSLTPTGNVKVGFSLIGRGNLLLRISSPVLNIISNTAWGSYQAVERRLTSGSFGGANPEYARQFVAHTFEVYQKSGFDPSRMLSLADEQTIRGEKFVSAQGPGVVRKVARAYEDVVFKQMMGAPDVVGAAIAFADSANIESTLIATRKEGLSGAAATSRALAIFKDAARVDPQTLEGTLVRQKAIADAQVATFTNDSKYAEVSMGIREIMNRATGDLSLGDNVMPFVKTPANIVGAGIDVSGVLTVPEFFVRGVKTFHSVYKGNSLQEAAREEFQGFAKKSIRAGFGFVLAMILSAMIDEDDFIGAYETDKRRLTELKRGVQNAVKIGGTWVSLDYFGPLASPFIGIMYAKKYGTNLPSIAFEYYKGAGIQAIAFLPGLEEAQDIAEGVGNITSGKDRPEKVPENLSKWGIDFLSSRMTPGIVSDLSAMTDEFDRETKGQGLWAGWQKKIPGLRQALPIKTDAFGDDINTQQPFSQLFFGSRVKEAQESLIIDELDRLSISGNLPALTKIEDTSTRLPQLLEQKGPERYQKAVDSFHEQFKEDLDKLIRSKGYQKKSDEEKKDAINDLKGAILDDVLKRAHYKTPKKGSRKEEET